MYGNDWITNDKKINEESLTNYMNKVNEIYKITDEKAKEVESQESESTNQIDVNSSDNATTEKEELKIIKRSLLGTLMSSGLYGKQKGNISYGAFKAPTELTEILGFINNNKDGNYKVMNRNNEKVFIPINCIGVNANSENKDTAKEFVKELLTEKSQSEINTFGSFGLPVNKKTIANSYEELKKKGELDKETNHYVVDYGNNANKVIVPNKDDINKLIGQIEELNVAAKLNKRLVLEAGKQFDAFQKGEISVEDAVNGVVKNLDLYLSEYFKYYAQKGVFGFESSLYFSASINIFFETVSLSKILYLQINLAIIVLIKYFLFANQSEIYHALLKNR